MKKSIKIILIIVVVGLVSGLSTVYYVFNKPHRNVEGEAPAYIMDAAALYNEYSKNETTANEKFGDKIIQVSGKIVELSKNGYEISIVLNDEMEGVNCMLDSMTIDRNKSFIDNLKTGDDITLKGKCDGFDMIMGVVLTRCFIINPE